MPPRARRLTSVNYEAIAFEHPETIVVRLLQDTLGAARRALDVAHPNWARATLNVHDLNQTARLAAIMAVPFIEMDKLLDAYLHARSHQDIVRQISQIDLPFYAPTCDTKYLLRRRPRAGVSFASRPANNVIETPQTTCAHSDMVISARRILRSIDHL